ncbi:MAG: plastocyanin/azurin family copper-binding protein [Actinomycetota bacterium]
MVLRVLRVFLLCSFALSLAACGGDATSSSETAASTDGETSKGTVGATVEDFAISLDTTQVSAGKVTFNVHNDGPSTHEFVVIKTNLASDALPLNAEGNEVDEDQVEAVDEAEDIASGTNASFSATLEPGAYVVICNITSHYEAGMHAALAVS